VLTSNTYGHVLDQRQLAVASGMGTLLGGQGANALRCTRRALAAVDGS
jgi:hypothetical protein